MKLIKDMTPHQCEAEARAIRYLRDYYTAMAHAGHTAAEAALAVYREYGFLQLAQKEGEQS